MRRVQPTTPPPTQCVPSLAPPPAPPTHPPPQVALAVGMVGLTYAAVPLYRMFCQATGYGGTVQEGKSGARLLTRMESRAGWGCWERARLGARVRAA